MIEYTIEYNSKPTGNKWKVKSSELIKSSKSFKIQKEAVKWAEGQIKKHDPATGGRIMLVQKNRKSRLFKRVWPKRHRSLNTIKKCTSKTGTVQTGVSTFKPCKFEIYPSQRKRDGFLPHGLQ